MPATVFSALLVCVAALLLGQGVLRLCGWRAWSWLAPAVGVCALMLLAVPALHVPGRSVTCAVVIAVVCAASLWSMSREPALRPPPAGVVAGVWPLLLGLVPFAVAGRSGTLGVSVSNDMSAHLLLAAAHTDAALTPAVGPSYPLGPHAVVAALADPLGTALDHAFAGFTIALPVLLGWTALGVLRSVGWVGQSVLAAIIGMPFLIAAYVGQGAFKEVLMSGLVLAVAVLLGERDGRDGRLRWVPMAVLVAGMISVYSYTALLWPVLLFGAWAAGSAITTRGRGAAQRWGADLRREAVPVATALLVCGVVLVPQLPRVHRYFEGSGGGTGLAPGVLGNLLGPLPFWEGFGVWDNPDFRMPAHDALAAGAVSGAVLVLAVFAGVWWLSRGEWIVPVAAAICGLIWLYSDHRQSPYVAAKALVIFTPVVLTVAARPLLEHDGWRASPSRWLRFATPFVLTALVYAVIGSSWHALRGAPVGPRDHLVELRSLRATVGGASTLFLGNDDFIRFALDGTPVQAPFIGAPGVATRPEKAWSYGQAFDFDSVPAEEYQTVSYVIATRDAAASQPPRQLRLVRTTRDFALYRRVGSVPPYGVLPEGEAPGVVLDCRRNARMRGLSRRAGAAVVRGGGAAVTGPSLGAGGQATVRIAVPDGAWDVVAAYTSGLPITMTARGMAPTTLSANLDRPGPRYPIGRVRVSGGGGIDLRVRVRGHLLASTASPAIFTSIIAVPVGTARTVELHQACGLFVDHFNVRPAGDA